MANRTLPMNDAIHGYLVGLAVDESDAMRALRDETASMPAANMQIGPEQGAFMAWLVRTLGVKRVVEVGTFTGYSALAMARAMPDDGAIVCCDVSEEFTRVARKYWERAGVASKIDLRVAPAADTLQALLDDGGAGAFDFAFIDADKGGYDTYYERCLALLRPGGVIAIDNVLWGGSVIDDDDDRESTVALRAINEKVFSDARVSACMLPVGDGITLATKK